MIPSPGLNLTRLALLAGILGHADRRGYWFVAEGRLAIFSER